MIEVFFSLCKLAKERKLEIILSLSVTKTQFCLRDDCFLLSKFSRSYVRNSASAGIVSKSFYVDKKSA